MEFEQFWRRYPRKVGRIKAERCWKKMKAAEQESAIIGLGLWKQTTQWNTPGGEFVPYASTFLAQRRWEDEPWNGAFEEAKSA